MADGAGETPEALTHAALLHLPKMGLMDDPGAREAQMMAILYTVLQLPTRSPDRPGAVHSYAAAEDIDVKLDVRDDRVTAHLKGRLLGH
jgi:hypothetical protein